MKPWTRWIGSGLAVAGSLAFIVYVVSTLRFADLAGRVSLGGLAALFGAVALYCLVVPLAALAWQVLLGELGHPARYTRLNAILLATQAGKYLPGNVGQHLGRVALSLSLGIPAAVLLASMAYEFVLILIADVLTGVSASALSGPGLRIVGGERGAVLVGVVALAVAALAAIPLLGRLLPGAIKRFVPEAERAGLELPALKAGGLGRVVAIDVAAMLCVVASISVLALGLLGRGSVDFALLTAAFTIAWAVGFVTPGAPAGIGVREALLLVVLGPALGAADASLLILALRIATTLGDLLCFAIGMALLGRERGRPRRTPQP
jgi:uncharacterized membrane protein YbhN (UPF0104 family)